MTGRPPLGQHFLVDGNLVGVAVRMAELAPSDVALEVGPGLGVLTAALASACRHVHAVEIDTRLAERLEAAIGDRSNVTVTWADALQVDLAALHPAPTALVSNLPYAVATPIVVESIHRTPSIGRWCVMVQREVADRFFAAPGTPAYGAVSVLLQLAARRTGFHPVSRTVFRPPPNVDSALVAFVRREEWAELAAGWPAVRRLVQAAFAHRRKTLANSLQLSGVVPRADAEAALQAIDASPGVRAEALEPARFVALAQVLADRGRRSLL